MKAHKSGPIAISKCSTQGTHDAEEDQETTKVQQLHVQPSTQAVSQGKRGHCHKLRGSSQPIHSLHALSQYA